MNHQDGFFKGVCEAEIYHQGWLPEDVSKASLVVVHGLAEHSGRYGNLVDQFVPSGYAVYSIDHLGHGKSQGTRVYVDRFQDYIATLKIFLGMVQEWQPKKPIFLIGHSMGGLISAAYVLQNQENLAGIVFSGPGIKVPDDISQGTIFMGRILSKLLPKTGIIKLDAEGVSRDPVVVSAYINDPLVYTGKITARLGAEMLRTMQEVTQHAHQISLPIMIVQGGADSLIDPQGAQLLYDAVESEDKTIKVYEDCYHEVFNEPEHKQILNDVMNWIEERL